MNKNTKLLKIGEVAEYLRVSVQTVMNYIKDGTLDAIQLKGVYRIEEQALTKFLSEHSTKKEADTNE